MKIETVDNMACENRITFIKSTFSGVNNFRAYKK